jgi:hypothetical protein
MGRAFEIVATCLQRGGGSGGGGRGCCSLTALTIFALDCTTESRMLRSLQTITTNMIVAMAFIRAAIANFTGEGSTTICVGLDFAKATGEICASCFLVAAITSTTQALSASMIVAYMLQVANTTREPFAGPLFFTTIPDITNSTATAILATDLDEMGRAFEIVATCLQRGCGGGGGGRGCCPLTALTIFALDCTTESRMLSSLQTITTHMIVTMAFIRAAIANLTSECSTAGCVGLDFAKATSEISARRFFVTAITSTTCALATSMIITNML